jgi:hypothetical protein
MWLWRPTEAIVGLVFVAGAILKAGDVNLFAVQISRYGVLSNPALIDAAAVGTLWIETSLGLALVLGARLRGAVHAATLAVLAGFTGLIAYAWAFHNIADCGCFGPIEMSPGISIAKNLILAAACLGSWLGYSRSLDRRPRLRSLLIRYGACAVAACGVAGYAYAHLEAAPKQTATFSQFVFEIDGEKYDLGRGEYFVAILSMKCDHCMASVPEINALAETPGFPQVVALCYEEEKGAMDTFEAETGPDFPLYSMGSSVRTFSDLIGQEPPRFYLVRDGMPLRFWDKTVPLAEEVLAARDGPSGASPHN